MVDISPKKARLNMIFMIILVFVIIILWFWVGNPFNNPTIPIVDIPNTQQNDTTGDFLLYENTCNFQKTGDYKYIDIAGSDNRIYTKSISKYINYTKSVNISGNIDNVWLCVIADISDKSDSYAAYKKENSYYGMVYLYFDPNNNGYINVSYYKSGGQYYDADTDSTHTLGSFFNGQFWSSETPKKFLLNLNDVIVADKQNGWYKHISPISLFKNETTLNIGGFMAPLGRAYRASSISSYRLIYKGDGEITFK